METWEKAEFEAVSINSECSAYTMTDAEDMSDTECDAAGDSPAWD